MSAPTPKPGLLGRIPLRAGTRRGVLLAALGLALAEFVRSGFYMGFLVRILEPSFHLPVSVVLAAWSAHLITDTLMRGPAGAMLQRYGPRRVVTAGALVSLLALSLMLVAKAPWVIFAVAILHGIGFSPMWPAAMNITADSAKEGYQGRVLSLVSTSIMPLTGIGLFAFGALGKKMIVTPTILLALGVLAGVVLMSLLLPLARPLHPQQEKYQAAPRSLIHSLLPLLPAAFMQTFTQSMIGAPILYVAPKIGLSDLDLIALLVVGGGLAFGSMPFTGKFADGGHARASVALGYGLLTLAFAGIATLPPVWLLFVLAAIGGLGYAFLTPGWAALITQMLPEAQRPAAWGVIMTVESGGFAAGPAVGGLALAQGGAAALFALGSVLALLTSLGYVIFKRVFMPVQVPHSAGQEAQP